jgi:hypothetical protein
LWKPPWNNIRLGDVIVPSLYFVESRSLALCPVAEHGSPLINFDTMSRARRDNEAIVNVSANIVYNKAFFK